MFDTALELWYRYVPHLAKTQRQAHEEALRGEVGRRLADLNRIIALVRESEEGLRAVVAQLREARGAPSSELLDRTGADTRQLTQLLRIHVETFYWSAARLRAVLRATPGLRSFEAVGVRNVRNKLLEHPESPDSRLFDQSFMFNGERGAVMKVSLSGDQGHPFADAGLDANAEEFRAALEAVLMRALAGFEAPP